MTLYTNSLLGNPLTFILAQTYQNEVWVPAYIYKGNFVDLLRETKRENDAGTTFRQFSRRGATLNARFSAAIEPILDPLDIFSEAMNLKNTLVLLFLRHLHPIIGSEWCHFAVLYKGRWAAKG